MENGENLYKAVDRIVNIFENSFKKKLELENRIIRDQKELADSLASDRSINEVSKTLLGNIQTEIKALDNRLEQQEKQNIKAYNKCFDEYLNKTIKPYISKSNEDFDKKLDAFRNGLDTNKNKFSAVVLVVVIVLTNACTYFLGTTRLKAVEENKVFQTAYEYANKKYYNEWLNRLNDEDKKTKTLIEQKNTEIEVVNRNLNECLRRNR